MKSQLYLSQVIPALVELLEEHNGVALDVVFSTDTGIAGNSKLVVIQTAGSFQESLGGLRLNILSKQKIILKKLNFILSH